VARRTAIIKLQFVYVSGIPSTDTIECIATRLTADDISRFRKSLDDRQREVMDQLRSSGLWEYTSPNERRIFESAVGEMTTRQIVDTSWRAETLCCLVWALGLTDKLPHFDKTTDSESIVSLIQTGDLTRFCHYARLRAAHEIEAAREVAELWHWRSRTRQLQENGYQPPPNQPALDSIVCSVAKRMVNDRILPPAIDGDFPAFGRAYRDLSESEWSTTRSITLERHFALNWLCGYAPGNNWDETPTNT